MALEKVWKTWDFFLLLCGQPVQRIALCKKDLKQKDIRPWWSTVSLSLDS